jgi:hypothetical protein
MPISEYYHEYYIFQKRDFAIYFTTLHLDYRPVMSDGKIGE